MFGRSDTLYPKDATASQEEMTLAADRSPDRRGQGYAIATVIIECPPGLSSRMETHVQSIAAPTGTQHGGVPPVAIFTNHVDTMFDRSTRGLVGIDRNPARLKTRS